MAKQKRSKGAGTGARIMITYAFQDDDGKPREPRNDAEREELDSFIRADEQCLSWPGAWAREMRPTFERWSKDPIERISEWGKRLLRIADLIEAQVLDGDHRGIMELLSMMLTGYMDVVEEINNPMLELAKKRYSDIRMLPAKKKAASERTRANIKMLKEKLGGMSWERAKEAYEALPPDERKKYTFPSRSTWYDHLKKPR